MHRLHARRLLAHVQLLSLFSALEQHSSHETNESHCATSNSSCFTGIRFRWGDRGTRSTRRRTRLRGSRLRDSHIGRNRGGDRRGWAATRAKRAGRRGALSGAIEAKGAHTCWRKSGGVDIVRGEIGDERVDGLGQRSGLASRGCDGVGNVHDAGYIGADLGDLAAPCCAKVAQAVVIVVLRRGQGDEQRSGQGSFGKVHRVLRGGAGDTVVKGEQGGQG